MNLAPELGAGPLDASLWLIGRDYGQEEAWQRQPFVGQAGAILSTACRTAGIDRATVRVDNLVPRQPPGNDFARHRPEDVRWGEERLTALLTQHRPKVIVGFGNEVARFLVGAAWPAEGIQALRGYLWDTRFGRVLTTVHPAAILREWTPWRALLDFDLRRAATEVALGAPPLTQRDVVVVTQQAELDALTEAVRQCRLLAVDIENTAERELACMGFAPTPERAWVIPAHADWQLAAIRTLCESDVPKVLQNGQYDRFFLRRFAGIELRAHAFDTQLAWHALNPELAGKKVQVGNRKAASSRTAKSLQFLASLYTRDPYWKDYGFTDEMERYVLCGRDCGVTLDVAQKQTVQLAAEGLRAVHDFELALLDPCLAMTTRGLPVDEPKRQRMLEALRAQHAPLEAEAQAAALAALAAHPERVPAAKAHLFRERRVCPCCRNGKGKREACWACAGFTKKPTKRMLAEAGAQAGRPVDIAPCAVCGGAGASEGACFNPASPQQVAIVLYDVLKLPKRTKDGVVRADEEALKSLLAEAKPEAQALIRALLRVGKLDTMRSILERLAPGPDGRIRTVYNPAGTVTGRFASAETFLIESTNLSNLPKREAVDADFDVRACIVAPPGFLFVEADLSGAEAWPTAACAGDMDLLARLRAGEDLHRWTAAYILTHMGKPTTPEQVTAIERQIYGKFPRHALNYGMQWQTFQRDVNMVADRTGMAITAAQAKAIYAGYHALHPKLQNPWWREVQNAITVRRSLTTCFGRRRTFYGRDAATWLSETHRSAIAQESQSTIADLLNRGLLRWWKQHDGRVGELVAQVYDSVLILVPQARAEVCAALVRRCLTEDIEVHGVRFTIPVDVKVCKSWAAVKDAPAREAA